MARAVNAPPTRMIAGPVPRRSNAMLVPSLEITVFIVVSLSLCFPTELDGTVLSQELDCLVPTRKPDVTREDGMAEAGLSGRSARKRKVIMEAATRAFLRQGYLGTSMDEVAAQAAVSKQTVYKHFSDKKRLFADIVNDTTGDVDEH